MVSDCNSMKRNRKRGKGKNKERGKRKKGGKTKKGEMKGGNKIGKEEDMNTCMYSVETGLFKQRCV